MSLEQLYIFQFNFLSSINVKSHVHEEEIIFKFAGEKNTDWRIFVSVLANSHFPVGPILLA